MFFKTQIVFFFFFNIYFALKNIDNIDANIDIPVIDLRNRCLKSGWLFLPGIENFSSLDKEQASLHARTFPEILEQFRRTLFLGLGFSNL